MNFEALEALGQRALALEALVPPSAQANGLALPETVARLRVFAQALTSTRDNLTVLEGVSAWRP